MAKLIWSKREAGLYGRGTAYIARTQDNPSLEEGVYLYCARIVVNPRIPKGDRRRYRFEWRATVADGHRAYEEGRVIATGKTSAEVQAAVEQMVEQSQDKEVPVTINPFAGEYRFLSNFHPAEVYGYPSNEHFFQAMKTTDREARTAFKDPNLTPGQAKRLGARVELRSDWEEIKDDVMLVGLRDKFTNPELKELLLATGDAELIEGNYWHDNYWGDCTCGRCRDIEGQNKLGKLLMQVREEMK